MRPVSGEPGEAMSRHSLLIEFLATFFVGAAALLWLSPSPVALVAWTAICFAPFFLASRATAVGFVRVAIPIVLGAIFVVAYDLIHATPALAQFISEDVTEYDGEQYYAVISTLFALLTALILVKEIESFDRLNTAIGEEANKVRSIVEFMYYFEEEDGEEIPNIAAIRAQTRRIRQLMRAYCLAFLVDPSARDHKRSNEILRRSTQEVGALECNDENDKLALAEVMRALNELFAIRARRVAAVRARIPLYMMVALIFMSLAIVFPFFIGTPENHPYAKAFIFVLTAFCTFVLVLLRDINAPFDGFWQVDLDAFRTLRVDLEAMLEQEHERPTTPPRRLVSTALRRMRQ